MARTTGKDATATVLYGKSDSLLTLRSMQISVVQHVAGSVSAASSLCQVRFIESTSAQNHATFSSMQGSYGTPLNQAGKNQIPGTVIAGVVMQSTGTRGLKKALPEQSMPPGRISVLPGSPKMFATWLQLALQSHLC